MTINTEVIEKLLCGDNINFSDIDNPLFIRLKQALQGLDEATASKHDVAVLIRQILRFYDSVSKGNYTLLPIKDSRFSFTREELEAFGLRMVGDCVNAMEWNPQWLENGKYSPVKAAEGCEDRRETKRVLADPFITKQTGYCYYHNIAQRDAIRALLSMPDGATLTVNIPTGSGKSLVAWLPSLLGQGLTVVIVPITSLALDQEEALVKKGFSRPLAYHGGSDAESVSKRKDIRSRIRNDRQRILFTSPESLNTSLYDVLIDAAYRGELTHFVVDEAHMIYEWGNDFRSSFLKIAGVRRAFIKKNKALKTVLLSATYTSAALDLLKCLFSDPGPFKLFSSVQLRPEPSYWFKKCNEDEKLEYIKEVLYHVPRPLIIYTTRVEDAGKVYKKIKEWGFKRSGILTGKSVTGERSGVVQKWKNHELDIVVGTSAFGLGIDQAHVRAVIHACVPESLDRYYQEIGRGGRDGRASMSLMLYTEKDLYDAKGLSADRILTIENGWGRWKKMFETKSVLPDGRYRLDLSVKPRLEVAKGDKNEGWNLKALLLMVQAGLLVLDEERLPKPELTDDEKKNEENWQNYIEGDSRHQIVKIIDSNHFDEAYWKTTVGKVRDSIIRESRRGYTAMLSVLDSSKCVSENLNKFYSSTGIPVVEACGGCPSCRVLQRNIKPGFYPKTRFSWDSSSITLKGDLKNEFSRTRRLIIFYKQTDRSGLSEKKFSGLINWVVSKGIRIILSDKPELVRGYRSLQENPTFLFSIEERLYLPSGVQLRVCFDKNQVPKIFKKLDKDFKLPYPEVYFLPYESLDPTDNKRYLHNMIASPDRFVMLDEFLNKYRIA